jgi:flavin-dependent dehydrogenase
MAGTGPAGGVGAYDVLVVGARCAGAPLATLLARRGARVGVLERATFPRDTLSSHVFEADALAFLDRLGLTERLQATGAPYVTRMRLRLEDLELDMDWPQAPGDVGGLASIRRAVLDPILADAAAQAGADVRFGAGVRELLRDGERVVGVRTREGDELRARLVVGADGRNSTVGALAGARRYNLIPSRRIVYWGFFETVDAVEPAFVNHRWADRFVLGIPSDGGLYQALVWAETPELPRFRADLEGTFMEEARRCGPIAEIVDGARRVGRVQGAVRWVGFFREASGPGWVLTGDAGHFKDPGPGRGIGDAFLQAERLAPAILAGLDEDLDGEMARWGRWRDREFAEHHWLASDVSAPGTVPAVLPELLRGLHRRGRAGLFFDLLNHRARPSRVLSPPRVAAATARAVARNPGRRLAVLREVGELLAQEGRRRWLNHRPAYAEPAGDAGATEVPEGDAAPAGEARAEAGR